MYFPPDFFQGMFWYYIFIIIFQVIVSGLHLKRGYNNTNSIVKYEFKRTSVFSEQT